MNKPIFTGVCTALVTPFCNGRIHHSMMEILIQRQIQAGIPALVVCGTTGEASTLSDKEKVSVICHAVNTAQGQCKIIAGTGSNNTTHAISLSIQAEESGADAVLVVSPYYNKATASGLIAHYTAIASAVHIPVIVYNVPARTGVDIPVEVYRELSEIPNIMGVKEASADLQKIDATIRTCGSGFSVWGGNDNQTIPVIEAGGKGIISVASNAFPEEMLAMTKCALLSDPVTAAEIYRQISPIVDALFCEVNPIPIKAAMKILGFDCGVCRLPLTPLSKENTDMLHAVIQKIRRT